MSLLLESSRKPPSLFFYGTCKMFGGYPCEMEILDLLQYIIVVSNVFLIGNLCKVVSLLGLVSLLAPNLLSSCFLVGVTTLILEHVRLDNVNFTSFSECSSLINSVEIPPWSIQSVKAMLIRYMYYPWTGW